MGSEMFNEIFTNKEISQANLLNIFSENVTISFAFKSK
jgi:hypothetical protein